MKSVVCTETKTVVNAVMSLSDPDGSSQVLENHRNITNDLKMFKEDAESRGLKTKYGTL